MSQELDSVSAKAHWAALFAGLAGSTASIVAGKLSGSYGGPLSLDLASIKSVTVSQSFFGKLLGFGTVLIATPNGTRALNFVANPEAFATELEDASKEAARKSAKPAAKAPAPAPAPAAAAPVPAPAPAPAPEVLAVERSIAPAAPAPAVEAAKQSTTSDEESYKGKTVAMSMEDFEALLNAQTEKK